MSAQPSFLDIRRQAETVLVDRALNDADFHDLLVKDPHGALQQTFGSNPVANLKINILEEKPGEVTIVLPAGKDELPDELLDLASGGTKFSSFIDIKPMKPKK